MSEVARDVVVHGTVQGVGFRFHAIAEAEDAGVAGWVRNEPDGTVRAHVEGDPDAVERVVSWLRHGPRHATVESVEVTETQPTGATRFDVR